MRFAHLLLAAASAGAQPLSLRDAVKTALERHPSLEAARAHTEAARTRVKQTEAARLPQLGYTEAFQTGNGPVYAFSTLLAQRRFTAADFAIDSLNHPGFINNFQSQVGASQTLWDAGAATYRIRAAQLGVSMTEEEHRALRLRRAADVARAYLGVVLAAEGVKVATAAMDSARADLARAEAVRDVGRSTEADVLAVKVHLATMREQEIRRRSEERVARVVLNEAMGLPLDEGHTLSTSLAEVRSAVHQSTVSRPEIRQAELNRQIAQIQVSVARAALYPQVKLRGVFEADRGRFVTRVGANWWMGASLEWNLFDGGANRNRLSETSHLASAAKAKERQVASAVDVEVRRARAALDSATERLAVASEAIAQAEESLRILKNRYEAGLAAVSDLLRHESALAEVRMRRLVAIHDQRLSAVGLELAKGTLSGDSDVLE